MAQIIQEGTPPIQLKFSFPDNWDICKFDDTNFYRNRVEKLNGVKSVDIIAKSNTVLHFIEIKDFRKHRIENTERQKNGELLTEVAQKFVSTVSALLGAKRCELVDFEPYYNSLFALSGQTIEIILFVERDDNESTLKRKKLTLADLQDKLKKLLVAYNVRCKVYDKDHLPSNIEWSVR